MGVGTRISAFRMYHRLLVSLKLINIPRVPDRRLVEVPARSEPFPATPLPIHRNS